MNEVGRAAVFDALREARERTWLLAEPLSDEHMQSAVTDYLSPPVWDLGHMANFEERWLVQFFLECPELHDGYNDIYNAFKHARKDRPKLRLLDREGVRTYMSEVRKRTKQVLDLLEDSTCEPRYIADWFLHWMLVLHEHQHQETLLQTLQLLGPEQYSPPMKVEHPAPVGDLAKGWVLVEEGEFAMGISQSAGVYDNEAPAHAVQVDAFRMARYPVTIGEFQAFVEAGGYSDAELWSKRGQEWLAHESHHAPLNWQFVNGEWHRIALTGAEPLANVSDEILSHVTYFEAEAYAKWIGARLPTEAEWEKAARWNPDIQHSARNPWGDEPADAERCSIDQLHWHPSRIGSRPDSSSALGIEHMIGDVWEWTRTDFDGYPGFEAFPYKEYSEVFFGGDYKILRGGSWATRAGCATATFRNWDHPYRRQIFSGIRLAMDA